jgi:replication-associated recombination protein RarA
MKLTTKRGYSLLDAASALQKSIRRGDARLAGYFAVELFESNYREYLWRRLLTISAEDCWGVITQEVWSLYQAWRAIDASKKHSARAASSPPRRPSFSVRRASAATPIT